MTLLKKGVSYGPIIVSRMFFSCTKCKHVYAVSENVYDPSVDIVCPKCQSIMLLSSTNTDIVEELPAKDAIPSITEPKTKD